MQRRLGPPRPSEIGRPAESCRGRAPGRGAPATRATPEQTLLYRIVAQHYRAFVELLAGQGRPLPDYVQQEFEAYLKCGRLEHGFLRVRCESGSTHSIRRIAPE